MNNTVIKIRTDQVSKLNFSIPSGLEEQEKLNNKQKLKAALVRPLHKRQPLKIIFNTERGFFMINSKPLGLGKEYATVEGGCTIPINSIKRIL